MREKLLTSIQDTKLKEIANQLYRKGATIGDGGTAAALYDEFYKGTSTHLIKAKEKLTGLNKLAKSGDLGLNDLDILEALRMDLERVIKLFD